MTASDASEAAARAQSRERLTGYGFLVALVVSLLVAWLAQAALNRQAADAEWARHTMEVMLEVEALNSTFQEALTAQRNFLITGEVYFSSEFEQLVNATGQRLSRARSLTSDNAAQLERLRQLEARLAERFTLARQRIQLREKEGLEAVRLAIAAQPSTESQASAEKLLEQIGESERRLLASRETATAESTRQTRLAMVAGSALAFGLVVVAFLLVRRGAEALRRANDQLEERVARRTAELQASEQEVRALNADLETRVAQRTAELAARTKELEAFSYSVSHDLKAPLRGIDGYSRLLLEDHAASLDAEGREFLGHIKGACAQMTHLIEDLLAYSRLERRSMSRTTVGLRGFVESILRTMATDLTRVTLENEIGDVQVAADPEGLAIAVRNLLDNAVKFSAATPEPRIRISTAVENGECCLSVTDNGTGFDMKFVEKVFEIFQRLHRAEDYPGTGVGLALVRKAMERMGGSVTAESAPGRGATFQLRLPMADG